MSAKRIAILNKGRGKQRGAALLVMLVILVVGIAAILVDSLTASSVKTARQATTAAALAQAKDALIGYAASDSNFPGELPCPDVNDDGQLTMGVDYSGSSCVSPIGRLPWKTLGIPELRDGAGEHLWYAVSKPFWAMGSPNINSDTVGNLTVTDSTSGVTVNNLIAIVFAPGSALSTQSRSSTQAANCTTTGDTAGTTSENNCATNYLEGTNPAATWNIFTAPSTAINTGYKTNATSTFNDQLITISHDQLFAPVETRIAREAKNCLDAYATSSNNKYPWPADDNDTTYTGNYNTFFGRIPNVPITTTKPIDPTYGSALLTALGNLQIALDNYSASHNTANASALNSAGQTLSNAASNSYYSYSSTFYYNYNINYNAYQAGNYAQSLYISTTQSYINNTNNYLGSGGYIDNTMSLYWPSGCVFSSGYWNYWQNEVFFQVANGYRPGSSSSCGTSCLTINGNGTYRAAVIVGRAHNATGSITSNPPYYYLEGSNLHDSSGTSSTISKAFVTYSPGTANYTTVNDLVLCLDGGNTCK